VKKIPFLGVVIRERKVEIEKDKVGGVLKWSTLQYVWDVKKFLGLML